MVNCIEKEKRSQQLEDFEFLEKENIERTLGIVWHIENDSFGFHISLKDTPLTRRGILSSVSSIFDPLGIASPFLLKGRLLLQQIVSERKDWDDILTTEQISCWERWRREILELGELQIPRCYKKTDASIISASLYTFSDASEIGYGSCTYLRQVDAERKVSVSLVMGKSRVAPMKTVTIPRLELMAADMSTKLSTMINGELDMELGQPSFFTDSKVVLGYLMNEHARYRVFVANRVHRIRNNSSPDNWNYIESAKNPADVASRGLCASEKERIGLWLNGPKVLMDDPVSVSTEQGFFLDEADIELKKVFLVKNDLCLRDDIFEDLYLRVSSWIKIKRVVAIVSHICTSRTFSLKSLTVEDIQHAE